MASVADSPPLNARLRAAPDLSSLRMTALVWAGMASVYLAVVLGLGLEPYDGDDLMRLAQVRDLLAGQAWFDVTQYRMDPPGGASMHWSRLVDLPLAGLMLALGLVLPQAAAEQWASMLVPLGYLGGALLALRAILLRLGFAGGQVLAGLGLAALFPLVPAAFAPMRIDHHSAQALAALVMAVMLLRPESRRAAVLAGLAAAVWLVISLEGLPVVALFAAILGLRYVVLRDGALVRFLCALAVAAPLLSLATRPMSELALWCDILLPAHCAAFAAAAAVAALIPRLPAQDRPGGRLAALALLPLVCGPLAVAMLGECLAGPFTTLDPLLRTYWHGHIYEGLPIWQQPVQLALPALYTLALIPAGLWAARCDGRLGGGAAMRAWLPYALLALGVAGYGLLLLREMLVAQLLAVPFALALIAHLMPRARAIRALLPRVLATVACVLLVTPAGAAILGKQLEPQAASTSYQATGMRAAPADATPCDFADLRALDGGMVFATFNSAPAILAKTGLGVTTGGYHRNADGLRRIIAAFTADAEAARGIVRGSGADYLVACLDDDSLTILARGRPQSLARALLDERPPAWLEPVAIRASERMPVFAVR